MNLTAQVKAQLLKETGISSAVLDAAVDKAEQMIAANVQQESYKGFRRVVTQEAITVFNKIYDDAISISRIAGYYFKNNAAVSAQFNYSRIVAGISGKSRPPRPSDDDNLPDQTTTGIKPIV
jgi:hypothetical protein